MKKHLIKDVIENSIADQLDIKSGDYLLSIDGNEIKDIFDYHLLSETEYLTLEIEASDGEIWEIEIEKDEDQDLGIIFNNELLDEYKSCTNKCIFCFIDQMPPGMRETLYFKDDDSRLSFIQGNYVTLTNMTDDDVDRIIRYNLSPINISVHTMDKELRCKMLNNRFAGEKLEYIKRLNENNITMNAQIVLCKGYNDKEKLDETLEKMMPFIPNMKSCSVVPAGLTKYREGLAPLEPFTIGEAKEVIDQVDKWQKVFKEKFNINYVYAADEFYMMSNTPIPDEDYYDGYPQIENGVGMTRSYLNEFYDYLDSLEGDDRVRDVSVVTGVLFYNCSLEMADAINKKFPNVNIRVYKIINDFFGHTITVTGLLVGEDIINQLKGKEFGDELLLPANTLKFGEDIFLDDVTLDELKEVLQTTPIIVKSNGKDFVDKVLGEDNE
ncbi:MAG: DUF512 domain-containing protein [Eubacterium sp.]|nr:DUF512 domain-containing protein [Eubacterium sp.]